MRKLGILLVLIIAFTPTNAQMILDHEVVVKNGKLLPWTEYSNVLIWSMNFLKNCPTYKSKFGDDPLFLVTSRLNKDGTFRPNQNNQGSNAYYGLSLFNKYYAYTGDREAMQPVKKLLQRVAYYHTPDDWIWPGVPRTQDDSPDGEYTDEWGEIDKICMVASGYINYFKQTGDTGYFSKAEHIARTVLQHIHAGNETNSPLPYRVNLKTGKILDAYTADMIMAIELFDELLKSENSKLDQGILRKNRDLLWHWMQDYPLKNYLWSGYYEDVVINHSNLNQQIPMETARYILDHPQMDPEYKKHVPALIHWVENRFGQVKHYGATSIREQDGCFSEMSSHTARYASVVAKWFGVCLNEKVREEARASFALATYSAYNQYSKNQQSINYTGIGYIQPWFSDSYWDYLPHLLDGTAELPEMLPKDEDHLFYSSSTVTKINYARQFISYRTYDVSGMERIKLTFIPEVRSKGKILDKKYWHFGTFRGIDNVLIIKRNNINQIEISKKA